MWYLPAMHRRAELLALGVALDCGDDDAAYEALSSSVDPLLRGWAKRRVRRAIEEAMLRVPPSGNDMRHVLRLAYLDLAGQAAAKSEDEQQIVAKVNVHRKQLLPRKNLWWASGLACALCLAGAVVGGVALFRAIQAPDLYDPRAKKVPPATDAFVRGGRPRLGGPAAHHLFKDALSDFVIALDRARRPAELDQARAAVLTDGARAELGASTMNAVASVLHSARQTILAQIDDADDKADELLANIDALNGEVAAQGLGYYVDATVMREGPSGRVQVVLYCYTVEHVSVFESGDVVVRALQLRRLDGLNWSHAALGFTRKNIRDGLVLLDKVERELANRMLSALVKDAPMRVWDQEDKSAWQVEIEARAGEVVRETFGGQGSVPLKNADELGALLARREALFASWKVALGRRSMGLSTPDTYRIDVQRYWSLEGPVARRELEELADIDEKLGEPRIGNVFEAALFRMAESVEYHEVQHRLDHLRRHPLPMPKELSRWVGAMPSDPDESSGAGSARLELSAYLSELTRSDVLMRLNLTILARFSWRRVGGAEYYSALVVLDGLAHELGLPKNEGMADQERLARHYLAISRLPVGDVQTAARVMWERMFDTQLPPMRKTAGTRARPRARPRP